MGGYPEARTAPRPMATVVPGKGRHLAQVLTGRQARTEREYGRQRCFGGEAGFAQPPPLCRLCLAQVPPAAGENLFQALYVTMQNPLDGHKAETKAAQSQDLLGAADLRWPIGSPACRRAQRHKQAPLLIETQSLCGNAQPARRFRWIEIESGMSHESPRFVVDRHLFGSGPKGRVKRLFALHFRKLRPILAL